MAAMTSDKSWRKKGSPPVRLMSRSEAGSLKYSSDNISPVLRCFQMSHITQRALQFSVTATMAEVGFMQRHPLET